jgi:hypothetical protein
MQPPDSKSHKPQLYINIIRIGLFLKVQSTLEVLDYNYVDSLHHPSTRR